MKKLILILSFCIYSAINMAGQCVKVSSDVTICQGSTLSSLGGSLLNGTKTISWSDNGVGGTFSPNATTLAASWTPPAIFYGTAQITLTATTGCTSTPASASFNVTVTKTPVAGFSYPATPYCSDGANPLPVFSSGGQAGAFSSTAGLVFISTSTGQINLSASTAGSYTVTNTISASEGCNKVTATSPVTITRAPSATITYAGNPFCKSVTTAQAVTRTGTAGGTYSSSTGLTINSTSGAITPSSSTPGNYVVTYTMPATGACSTKTAITSVTITAIPVASFSFPSNPYCSSAADPLPVFSGGGSAGLFSSTAGLVFISTSTGQVDLSASTPGTYSVTNTIAASGGCSKVSATGTITITAAPAATITYAGSPYCKSLTTAQSVTRTGTSGGVYSSSPGLTINSSSGAITPSSSNAGTYTVSYTLPASGGCSSVVATTSVIITAIPASPIIGQLIQPTCTVSTGSVSLGGLPETDPWKITVKPTGSTFTGTGNSTTISSLLPNTYSFTVSVGNNCSSASSSNAVINSQPVLPSAPVIGTITQPTCAEPSGSVILTGLPASGTWTIIRSPDNISQNGSGTSATVTSLNAGTYTFIVVNSQGCSSSPSSAVVIGTAAGSPSAPVIGLVTQPTCNISTGSAELSGLPSVGNWTITRYPDVVQFNGSGQSYTVTTLLPSTYTFTVKAANGCVSQPSTPLIINPQPQIPTAPLIGSIIQPNCTSPTGSVILSGLPSSGTWTLTRFPGTIISSGTGTNTTVTGLPAGIYNFTVMSEAGCLSVPSANAIVSSQPLVPDPPLLGSVTQPTQTVPYGSVILNGLPNTGNWTLIRLPDNYTVTGAGQVFEFDGIPVGTFTFTVSNSSGCTSGASNQLQIISPGVQSLIITDPPEVCYPSTADLTNPDITRGSSPGLTYSYWLDQAATTQLSKPETAVAGIYYIKGTSTNGFTDIKPVVVTSVIQPVAYAGPDQELDFVFTTNLDASIDEDDTGFWTSMKGSQKFKDPADPKTEVTDLSIGTNTLVWTVSNIACPSVSDTVNIEVQDITIPSLITPNMDGKNDFFTIKELNELGKCILIVFDRTGAMGYKNTDYNNDWNGVDFNNRPLPEDTYFYSVRSASGRSYSGFVVIRRF